MKKAGRKLVAAARKELDAELARLEELASAHGDRLRELTGQVNELDRERTELADKRDRVRHERDRVRAARKALDDLRAPGACRERCVCGECGPRELYRSR